MKIKVTAKKFEGDDAYSWAIFRSDKTYPVFTGLNREVVPYYKKAVQEIIREEKERAKYEK